MDEVIQFTTRDVFNLVLAISGAIVSVSAAVTVMAKVFEKIKAPDKKQNERIAALEGAVIKINSRLDDGSKHFAADSKRIDDLEESMKATNRIIIESLQALTAHAIDGNNTQELKDVKKSLNNYLINMV
ncbi:MAG: hypothetical protein IJL07_10580 [Lachnospiraceae bacterium]|nr:hypothetical protein [Lachnospiraceae bacterium]